MTESFLDRLIHGGRLFMLFTADFFGPRPFKRSMPKTNAIKPIIWIVADGAMIMSGFGKNDINATIRKMITNTVRFFIILPPHILFLNDRFW